MPGSGNFDDVGAYLTTSSPGAAFVWRGTAAHDFRRADAAPGEASLVVYDRGLVGAVTSNTRCPGEVANDSVTPSAIAAMRAGYTWVGHAEPFDAIGHAPEVALAVDVKGQIRDAARWHKGAFAVDKDRGVKRGEKRGLPAMTDWRPVYSTTQGRLYAIGGVDANKRLKGTIYTTRVKDAAWTKLATSYRPTTVLAATYANGQLWILDGTSTTARLAKVDVRTGVHSIIGEYSRNASTWDRHWLVAQPDGAVLLASSSRVRAIHIVSKISRGDRVSVGSTMAGALVHAPIADEAGVSRFIRVDEARLSARVSRTPVLLRLATTRELGAQL